jgi:hypothetical protein
MGDYLTRAQLRSHLGYRPEFVEDDVQIDAAIAAAEALIVDWCGRSFTSAASVADVRTYASDGLTSMTVDDVEDTATAVVETSSDRATWTAEDSADFFFDGPAGWPATSLCRISGVWPPGWVRVNAEHGWSAVPEAVTSAAKLVAAQLLARRHSPSGVEFAGGEFGAAVRSSRYLDPTAQLLLAPYRRVDAFAGVA